MSRYLIRRIEETSTILLHPYTEIIALQGENHLESVLWRDRQTGQPKENRIRHLFIMTGANPNTTWLNSCVALDADGFIKTGSDLSQENLNNAQWPINRLPYMFETSLPGVFAVGDVLRGNIKDVASAVGEGSVAISFIHKVLR
jgi:thioredoxin reductase (NADPH)